VWILNIHTRNTSSYSAAQVASKSGQQCWGCGEQEWPEYAEGKIDALIVRPFFGHFGGKCNSGIGNLFAQKVQWFGKN